MNYCNAWRKVKSSRRWLVGEDSRAARQQLRNPDRAIATEAGWSPRSGGHTMQSASCGSIGHFRLNPAHRARPHGMHTRVKMFSVPKLSQIALNVTSSWNLFALIHQRSLFIKKCYFALRTEFNCFDYIQVLSEVQRGSGHFHISRSLTIIKIKIHESQ
jgi:hypothetical protein